MNEILVSGGRWLIRNVIKIAGYVGQTVIYLILDEYQKQVKENRKNRK